MLTFADASDAVVIISRLNPVIAVCIVRLERVGAPPRERTAHAHGVAHGECGAHDSRATILACTRAVGAAVVSGRRHAVVAERAINLGWVGADAAEAGARQMAL